MEESYCTDIKSSLYDGVVAVDFIFILSYLLFPYFGLCFLLYLLLLRVHLHFLLHILFLLCLFQHLV